MKSANSLIVVTGLAWLGLTTNVGLAQNAAPARVPQAPATSQAPRPPHVATKLPTPAATAASADHNAVIRRYCVGCHSDTRKTGGLSLASFDVAHAAQNVDVAEKMIRKLQAGLMPPPLSPRPDAATQASLVTTLESTIDAAASAKPNPGGRTFQRLNRPEYARAVRDLLGLDVDAGNWLPLDQKSANFDNIADVQALSPTLLEAYLNAAAAISMMAVGDRNAPAIDHTYTNPGYLSQHPWDHVDGAPYGTRGGMVVNHVFPADAEYVFEVALNAGSNARFEDIDISINGERVALIEYETGPAGGADGRGARLIRTEPILVRAGQQRVAAAFVRKLEGPYEDLIRPHEWSFAGGGSGGPGITTLPHVRDLVIKGPTKTTGISETSSRQKIFSCRPTGSGEERPCARQIISRIGGEAYRRPLTGGEIDRLMPFYEKAAVKGGFEGGVRAALEAILAGPHFIFRLEKEPEGARPGGTYRVADVDLASRLSFFLWGALPDQELLTLANQNKLSAPGTLEKQARRMLADPKADALGLEVRRAVAAAAGRREGPPRSELLPGLRRQSGGGDAPRDGAVLQQPRSPGSQPARALSRRLHLRQRAARAPLRHPERLGQRVPPRRIPGRDAPRPARTGQRAGPDVAGQPHLAGAARQVGDGGPDGDTAAAAAARHPDARGNGRIEERQDADDARAHGDASRQPDVQRLPSLHGSDRPRARQLRRHREVADARERHAARHQGRLLRRHAGDDAGGAAARV